MNFLDPRHGAIDAIAFAARAEQDRCFAFDEKRSVQRRGLTGDQLRPKIRQVPAIFIFPNQQCIETGFLALYVGSHNALSSKRFQIDALLVSDVKSSLRKTLHRLLPMNCNRNISSVRVRCITLDDT
jgi:hypothetical protein